VLWFAAKTPTAYDQAHNRAVELWALLGTESDPAARQAVYLEMAATYNRMAGAWVPDDVPGGYDGDFAEDLADMAALCWVLAASEEALVTGSRMGGVLAGGGAGRAGAAAARPPRRPSPPGPAAAVGRDRPVVGRARRQRRAQPA